MTHYAVLIGNSQFPKADLSSLTSPPKDVEAFAAELAVEGRAFDQVIPLINQPRYEIEKILEPIFDADGAGKNDLVLLYYSGHGLPNNKNNDLYLATLDTEKERLKSTALSFETLYRWIKDSHCKRIVILLDCCYSGIAGDIFAKGDLDARFNALQNKVTSTCLMTAASNDQVALDQAEGGLSLFTKHLINGWRGEADRDGNITFDSLFDYVNQKVIEEKTNQVPKKFVKNANGQLILAKSGRDSRKERAKKITDYLYDLAKDERISHDIVTESRGILAKPLQELTQSEAAKDERLTELFSSHKSAEFMLQWGKLDAAVHEAAKQLEAQHIAEEAQRLATQQAELVQQAEAKRILAEQQRQQAEQEAEAAKRTAQQEKEKQAAVAKQLAEAKHREAEAAKKREAEAKQAAEEKRRKAEEAAKQAEERQRAEQAERVARDKQAAQQVAEAQRVETARLTALAEAAESNNTSPTNTAGHKKTGIVLSVIVVAILGVFLATRGEKPAKPVVAPPPAVVEAPAVSAMVQIPAGNFIMGSCKESGSCLSGTSLDSEASSDEAPQHQVQIAAFELGKTEVTVGQFRAFVKATSYRTDAEKDTGGNKGCYAWDVSDGKWDWRAGRYWDKVGFSQSEQHPVACVSWNDAQAYITWLNGKTQTGYRLPSEAEWEYAARAGTTTRRYWGDDADQACAYANVADKTTGPNRQGWTTKHECSDGQFFSAAVGSYKPNEFKLHDMLGNVREWTQDPWHGDYNGAPANGSVWQGSSDARVLRGGSWFYYPLIVRAANRDSNTASFRFDGVGFRLARTLP